MLTASHNPAKYNGIKLCLPGAKPVGQDTGLREIQAMVEEALDAGTDGDAPPSAPPAPSARSTCSASSATTCAPSSTAACSARSRWWPTPATAWADWWPPRCSRACPFDVELMYAELDGTFPNHPPDPIQPENLKDLQARVLEVGADVGLAFDGDADRVFLVDDQAQPMSGSTTTAMVAAAMLEKHPGATILYNLICSKAVPEVVRERGGKPVRTRVGHSFIKSVMAETGAVFGGEHSGHYYFADNFRADSGIIAALVVLELLSKADQPLSELRKPFERYAASGEINVTVDDPQAVVERVAAAYADADQERVDGLTVDLGDWWFNLRAVEHRARAPPQPRGGRPRVVPDPRGRGARPHGREGLTAMAPDSKQLDSRLLEILACPADRGPLLYFADEDSLYNPRPQRRYAIRDGIPIMLVDEAEAVDDAEHARLLAKAEADGIRPTFQQ